MLFQNLAALGILEFLNDSGPSPHVFGKRQPAQGFIEPSSVRKVLNHGGAAPQLLSVAPDCSSAVIVGLSQISALPLSYCSSYQVWTIPPKRCQQRTKGLTNHKMCSPTENLEIKERKDY